MCFLHLQKTTSPFFRLHQLRDESKQLLWLSWSSPILGSHKSQRSGPEPMETLTRCRFVKGWSTPRSGPSPSNLVYKSLTHTLSKLKKYHYTISQPPKESKIPKIVWRFKTFLRYLRFQKLQDSVRFYTFFLPHGLLEEIFESYTFSPLRCSLDLLHKCTLAQENHLRYPEEIPADKTLWFHRNFQFS